MAAGGSDGLVDHFLTHDAVECLLDTTQQTSLREGNKETKTLCTCSIQYYYYSTCSAVQYLYHPEFKYNLNQQLHCEVHKLIKKYALVYVHLAGIVVDMGTAGQFVINCRSVENCGQCTPTRTLPRCTYYQGWCSNTRLVDQLPTLDPTSENDMISPVCSCSAIGLLGCCQSNCMPLIQLMLCLHSFHLLDLDYTSIALAWSRGTY